MFEKRVTTVAELKALIGLPSELVRRKQLAELDDHMRAFQAKPSSL